MFLHASVDFQSPASMKLFEMTYVVCKQFTCRRIGSACRWIFIAFLIFITYMTSSYILSNPESKILIEEIGNETGSQIDDDGEIVPFSLPQSFILNEVVLLPPEIRLGEISMNCGLLEPCSSDEFSVHIYTGKDHKDEPRLCLDGKYILTKSINGGGRGINVVVVDNMTRTVSRVTHFDTYDKESTALETLLLTLRPGDIVILLTFDEPTRKLTRVARLLLHELGSALIQDLNYRGSWYLVTQKGMSGFSPFESLHIVESSGWPKHHDAHFCVPFQIKGQPVHPDPLPRYNPQRYEFCEKHTEYPLFCDADSVNDPLSPASALKSSSAFSRIYSIPIVVLSGEDINYLPVLLETLVKQSGLNPSLVAVFYTSEHPEVPDLCDLFGFMSVELSHSFGHCEHVGEAFETSRLLFPDAKEVISIQSNVVLSPDFLLYFGQTLPLLQMDESIIAVSAFNENGFKSVSEDHTLLYRVESFSGLAVLVRKNFFQRSWCKNDSDIESLFVSLEVKGDVIVPEVSRVLPVPLIGFEDSNWALWSSVFAHKRTVSYEDQAVIKDVQKLQSETYEESIRNLLDSATPVPVHSLSDLYCFQEDLERPHYNEFNFIFPTVNISSPSQIYVMYIRQRGSDDYDAFQPLCQCFGLFYHPTYSPRGLYRNMLRFTWGGHKIFVVGSSSPFYSHKSPDLPPLDTYNV